MSCCLVSQRAEERPERNRAELAACRPMLSSWSATRLRPSPIDWSRRRPPLPPPPPSSSHRRIASSISFTTPPSIIAPSPLAIDCFVVKSCDCYRASPIPASLATKKQGDGLHRRVAQQAPHPLRDCERDDLTTSALGDDSSSRHQSSQ